MRIPASGLLHLSFVRIAPADPLGAADAASQHSLTISLDAAGKPSFAFASLKRVAR